MRKILKRLVMDQVMKERESHHLLLILMMYYRYSINTLVCLELLICPLSLSLSLTQAIGQENERVDDQSSQLLSVISPSAPLPPPYLSPRPSMTFSATTQKLKETSIKIKTRGTELSNMIERDTLSINLFELQPLTEYGMYMRSFGQANTSQVFYNIICTCACVCILYRLVHRLDRIWLKKNHKQNPLLVETVGHNGHHMT